MITVEKLEKGTYFDDAFKISFRYDPTTVATARVAGISVELGMSVQNKSGIWCKPTVKMDLKIDGGTNPQQREAIIKQAFDEVCDNIEKTISEME
jgi:hypothetical protein